MHTSNELDVESVANLDAYCAHDGKAVRIGMSNPYPAKWELLSEEWRANTRDSILQWWVSTNRFFRTEPHPGFDVRTYDLRDALIAFGGEEVCMPFGSVEEVGELLSRGQLWGATDMMEEGEACHCHSNSAQLWSANQSQYFIATGFALSVDGLWRSHTWCVAITDAGPSVIETTVERLMYFGYVLTLEESEKFVESNCDEMASASQEAVSLHQDIYQGRKLVRVASSN